jgi:general secretion pathway protein C
VCPAQTASANSNADALRQQPMQTYLKLRGTLFTGTLNPVAIIEDSRDGSIKTYEIGDILDSGFEVSDIVRGQVIISTNGTELLLSFPLGAVVQPESKVEDIDGWYNIKRKGDTIILDRSTVSKAVLHAREIMRNVQIKPYSSEGKKIGVKVTQLKPVGVLQDIGVEESDIIKSVNGLSLNSPYEIFRAYRSLKDKEELRVDLIRNGRPLVLTYKVKK